MTRSAHQLLGHSPAIHNIERDIESAGRSDAKVLITGESGVGKEIVARLIHGTSDRARGAFVAINCAGLSETLLESELFGHTRGSFTGADRDRPGRLEVAHRGTLFLDEIGEMTLRMQGLLLRFLETGELQRVGDDERSRRVDARIIGATNRDLTEQMSAGGFREDLYYRLNVIHIDVAPLRERRDDIPLLARHFLEMFAAQYQLPVRDLAADAVACLVSYDWPGNVRELKNVIEGLVVGLGTAAITMDDLPEHLRGSALFGAARSETSHASTLFDEMVQGGQSFWSVVYAPFQDRDLTRDDVRSVIRKGLEQSQGSYRKMVRLFNVDDRDYRSFMRALSKHDCHLPFHGFRSRDGRVPVAENRPAGAAYALSS
jgi:transcriptional regulator with PAS, ATPase and Fis domain